MESGKQKYNPKQSHLSPHFGGTDAGTAKRKTALQPNVPRQKTLKRLIVTKTSGLAKYKAMIARAIINQTKETSPRRNILNGNHRNLLKTTRE